MKLVLNHKLEEYTGQAIFEAPHMVIGGVFYSSKITRQVTLQLFLSCSYKILTSEYIINILLHKNCIQLCCNLEI